MTLGTKLLKLRMNKKISQKKISHILEVSQTIYGKWESDIFYPTYKNLKKIAAFYNMDVESLTTNNVNNSTNNFNNQISNFPSSKKIITLLEKIEILIFEVRKETEILEQKIEINSSCKM
ncbi:helix-turn-helix domain-containing protein [Flavobacterium poyangense]|uniref:helix-turn-helix domain-containing protein n=1 Tax=Flavobacterium poyangense TaxID=2204302 RepID=UPI00141F44C7|nr:helix-turn-helix transcriptional regulator [Flavobacterium sp. JXAS1]